ncbi:Cullin [Schistosoma japonicum]|uniref:Cullin n=1 Tax=Schistosoma japonicum TaxID=6182 RepID=A0A4Z2D229_SCHJA|nr:Cullin [Schistosoma japonicum]
MYISLADLKGLPSASQIFEDSCLKLQKATKAVFLSEPVESTTLKIYALKGWLWNYTQVLKYYLANSWLSYNLNF